jgi:hypothetical protein
MRTIIAAVIIAVGIGSTPLVASLSKDRCPKCWGAVKSMYVERDKIGITCVNYHHWYK